MVSACNAIGKAFGQKIIRVFFPNGSPGKKSVKSASKSEVKWLFGKAQADDRGGRQAIAPSTAMA